ncbi:MAG: penicillin-binding protein, partial [Hyphomicrobiaceae bacterium]|nr:penicillin-binding protein [Hyphomicrobiaceae bacterium]
MARRQGKKGSERIEPRFEKTGSGDEELRVSGADRAAPEPARRRSPSKPASGSGGAQRPRSRTRRKKAAKGGGLRRFIGRAVYWSAILSLWGVIAVAGILAWYALHLPPPSEWRVPDRPPNIAILANDGTVLANRGDTGGEQVRIEHLPRFLPEAV